MTATAWTSCCATRTWRCTRAKAEGKGCIVAYERAHADESRRRTEVELELADALGRDEFRLFYQPQVSCRDGRVSALEALIRRAHRRGRLRYRLRLASLPAGAAAGHAEDRAFVAPLGERTDRVSLAGTVQLLAAGLGLESVAEGVESAAQPAAVSELGRDLVQG